MHMHSGDDVRSRDIELWPRQARGIRDKLIPLDKDEPEAQAAAEVAPTDEAPALTLRHVGGGRFNVIHPETGEAINDATLSKEEAEALIAAGGNTDGD